MPNKKLSLSLAVSAAKQYVRNQFKQQGYFSNYVLVVGEDLSHLPDYIYVEPLKSQLLMDTPEGYIRFFKQTRDTKNEFLIKVDIISTIPEFQTSILHTP